MLHFLKKNRVVFIFILLYTCNHLAFSAVSLNKKFINVGQTVAATASPVSSFTFNISGITSGFQVNANAPFELSKDGINFMPSLNYDSTISGTLQTVYVRMFALDSDKVYRKTISFTLNGTTLSDKVWLLGTSLPNWKTLRVMTWNMRWFGSPSNCSCDTALARQNATQIFKDMNADVYCLQEIVDTSQVHLIAQAMGTNYKALVSTFCSFAPNILDASYPSGQKVAFVYNTDKIESLSSYGLLASTYPANSSSTSPYHYFASGRWPMVMKALLKLDNGVNDTLILVTLHAKASGDADSYSRRVGGAESMTDSLNAQYPGQKIIIMGDYNDYLEGSQYSGATSSCYKYLLDNGFTGITLPSKFPGQTTFVGSANHILDNVVISNSMITYYPDSTCFIANEVNSYISNYENTTSDHIPVMSYFKFNFPSAVTVKDYHEISGIDILNPSQELTLQFKQQWNEIFQVDIFDLLGNKLYHQNISSKPILSISLPMLPNGLYIVELSNQKSRLVSKWMKSN